MIKLVGVLWWAQLLEISPNNIFFPSIFQSFFLILWCFGLITLEIEDEDPKVTVDSTKTAS